MNKEQFLEMLSDFADSVAVEALADQAEGKGYFNEAAPKAEASEQKCNIDATTAVSAMKKFIDYINGMPCPKSRFIKDLKLSEIIKLFNL